MFYTVYKTTCLLNGMYYYGVHKTKNIDDGYLGSGKYLQRAIKKYGEQNFTKEILFLVDNAQEMFDIEKTLITEEVLKDKKSYNCKLGGSANFYYINENKLNHKANQHLIHSSKCKANTEYREAFSKKMSKVSSFRKLNANRTPEERKAASQKAARARWSKMTREQRSKQAIQRHKRIKGNG